MTKAQHEKELNRLAEIVYDITLNAQHMCDFGQIEVDDSRCLFLNILCLAKEFAAQEQGRLDDPDYDYISEIDDFAEVKLCEFYGKG